MVQLGLLTAEAAGLFVAPGAPGPFPAAFPAGNALVDASSASIISCNAERGDCIEKDADRGGRAVTARGW